MPVVEKSLMPRWNHLPLLSKVLLGSSGLLYIVWPLPHAEALRLLLLYVAGFSGVALWVREPTCPASLREPWVLALALLFLWVMFDALVLSQNGTRAWGEVRGQWVTAYLALFAGIGCSYVGGIGEASWIRRGVVGVLLAQPLAFLVMTLLQVLGKGYVPLGHWGNKPGLRYGLPLGYWGFVDHKMSITFFGDIAGAFCAARLLERVRAGVSGVRLLPLAAGVVLGFYIALISNTRNSIIIMGVLSITLAARLLKVERTGPRLGRRALLPAAFLLLILAGASLSFISNSRWRELAEDAHIGMQINRYPNWINFYQYGFPVTPSGRSVSPSNYLRVAYDTAALRTLWHHPLGYGVSRHAFERLVQQRYPQARISDSHNGYLDLMLAVGIPAMLLLAIAWLRIIREAAARTAGYWSAPGVWVLSTIALYWALDPVSRDHYFQAFFLFLGLFGGLTIQGKAHD